MFSVPSVKVISAFCAKFYQRKCFGLLILTSISDENNVETREYLVFHLILHMKSVMDCSRLSLKLWWDSASDISKTYCSFSVVSM